MPHHSRGNWNVMQRWQVSTDRRGLDEWRVRGETGNQAFLTAADGR